MRQIIKAGTMLAACWTAMAGWQVSAAAQEVKLRVADSFPFNHFIAENITKHWMSEVERRTDGAVEFEYFPAEQLGKARDMLALTLSGVTDIGFVGPSYVSDKMPLSAVAELPGMFTTACAGTMAYWELAKEGGFLDENEFSPNGVRVLFALVLAPYQLYLRENHFENIASLEGLKLRSSSGAVELIRNLGAVSVQMPAPEVYQSLSRGAFDGLTSPIASIFSYDWQGLVKYATKGESFGSFVVTYVISEDRWEKLPADVQKAMTEAGEATTRHGCQFADKDERSGGSKLEEAGITQVELSEEYRGKLNEASQALSTSWAKALDARGKPGTEALDAFRAQLPEK
jgi:TRAP-type C4-dicarboxylate transport system substrate-binding protein